MKSNSGTLSHSMMSGYSKDIQIYASPPPGNCHATRYPHLGSLECPPCMISPISGKPGPWTSQSDLNRSHINIPELRAYRTPIVLPQQPVASVLDYPSQTEIRRTSDPAYYMPSPPLPFNDILTGVDSWPFQESCFSHIGGLASTHVSIHDLYELVRVVNDEWLQKLDSTPYIVSRCSKLASPEVFSRGIRAMQQCFTGFLSYSFEDMFSEPLVDWFKDISSGSPTGQFEDIFSDIVLDSFENIFSLVHVACACAYVLHKDEDSYDWDGFFDHMFQWQYLLSERDDVQCFLMAMDQLTCEHNYRLTFSLSGGGISDQECYGRPIDILRNGPVVKDFSRFLDGKSL